MKLYRIVIVLVVLLVAFAGPASAGAKDKVLAPVNAFGEFIGKVINGTNQTVSGLVAGATNAASGAVSATAELGEDSYRAVTDQPAGE